MNKFLKQLLVVSLLLPSTLSAQVFNTNQIISPVTSGWVNSNGVPTAKLTASSTPHFANFTFGNATGTAATTTDFFSIKGNFNNLCIQLDCKGAWPTASSGNVSTSSPETATYIPFWTSTNGTPALLSGGNSGFTFDNTNTRLSITNYQATNGTTTNATSTNLFSAKGNFTNLCISNDCKTVWPSSVTSDWQMNQGILTPTSTVPVVVGTTTKPFFFVNGDIFGAATSTNDFADLFVSNTSTGVCATAEFDAQSNSTSLTNFFSAFGHTGSNFTGSGCANTPYTDFGSNASYVVNPNGNINFGLGTTTSSARFAWYGAGYGNTNRLMTLTQPGYIGLGTNSPDSPLTISSAGATQAIVAPQMGTMIHLASSGGSNARITGDVYTGATSQGFVFQGRKARGGVGSPTAVNADDTLALLGGVGYGTTGFPSISAGAYAIRAEASGTDTSQPTYLSLLTTLTGTITPLERMRIDSNGRVGIGTSTPRWMLQIATSTRPQLTLSDNSSITNNHWSFRNAGGVLYVATSSSSTFATSTTAALTIDVNAQATFANHVVITGNSTTTNATTTNLFATTASTTNLYLATGTCTGSNALNVSGGKVTCGAVSAGGSSVVTTYAKPSFFSTAATVFPIFLNGNTVMFCGQVNFPQSMTINNFSINAGPVATRGGSAGNVAFGLYSEDGATRHMATTTFISTAGINKFSLAAPLALSSGNYYVCAVGASANVDVDVRVYTASDNTLSGSVTSEPVLTGTVTVSSGTLPATITPTSITSNANGTPILRFDN